MESQNYAIGDLVTLNNGYAVLRGEDIKSVWQVRSYKSKKGCTYYLNRPDGDDFKCHVSRVGRHAFHEIKESNIEGIALSPMTSANDIRKEEPERGEEKTDPKTDVTKKQHCWSESEDDEDHETNSYGMRLDANSNTIDASRQRSKEALEQGVW